MYSAPLVVNRAVPRRGGLESTGPLLAICCLIFILFLIATTIVLALIPLYLPTKSATAGGFTRNYSFVLTPNTTLGSDSNLDETSRIIIANAISAKLGFSRGATILDTAPIVTSSSERKRRGWNLIRNRARRARAKQKVYSIGRFSRRICGLCRIVLYRFYIVVVLFIHGVFIPIEFLVEIFVIIVNPPTPSISSTTITNSFTSTTTTSVISSASTSASSAASTNSVSTSSSSTASTSVISSAPTSTAPATPSLVG